MPVPKTTSVVANNLQCLAEIFKSGTAFSERDTDSKYKFSDIDAEIYGSGRILDANNL